MRVPRRLLPLLACAMIAGTPAVAHAQGAGDDQYADPFGGTSTTKSPSSDSSGSKTGSSSGSSSGSTSSGSGSSAPTLTQDPDLSSSSSASTASTATPATSSSTAPAATSSAELPRTGFDAPIVALLGLGLVAAGLGLRLRVAHGRPS